jgi:YVTN family beta-propeller protein
MKVLRITLILLLSCVLAGLAHGQTVAYVANAQSNNVSVIDTQTNQVVATIPVGQTPVGVVFSPDGTRAYITNNGSNTGGSISVIDTATSTVVATVPVGGSTDFSAITPDGKKLYVPSGRDNAVFVVDLSVNAVTEPPIPLGFAPVSMVVAPDNTRAFVLGAFGNTIGVIDLATDTLLAPINLSPANFIGPAIMAISPDGKRLYVPGGVNFTTTVIDTTTNSEIARVVIVFAAGGQRSVAVSPDSSRVYANIAPSSVFMLDAITNTIEAGPIQVGSVPFGMAITPDGSFLYVANEGDGTVSVVDTNTNTVVGPPITVGPSPVGIAIQSLSSPFASFIIKQLNIGNQNFQIQGSFVLGANSTGLDLAHQPVTLKVGDFALTIPQGQFRQVGGHLHFKFEGFIGGTKVNFDLKAENQSTTEFSFDAKVTTQLGAIGNPVNVGLKIGENTGTRSVIQQ